MPDSGWTTVQRLKHAPRASLLSRNFELRAALVWASSILHDSGSQEASDEIGWNRMKSDEMAMGQNHGILVNIKIDGKWMFIHQNMVQ